MADSRARDGHTSDSRATCAIVCVCTTRLPLKMQARPATSGLKDAPSRELYGVHAAEACGAAPTSATRPPSEKRPDAALRRAECEAGMPRARSAAGEVTSHLSGVVAAP